MKSRITAIIERLHSSDDKEREAAQRELRDLHGAPVHERPRSLTVTEGLEALRAATETFPPGVWALSDIAGDLVYAAASSPGPEYVPLLVELFPRYTDKARQWALHILAKLNTRESMSAFMEVMRRYAKDGGVSRLPPILSMQELMHTDILFPEILQYVDDPGLSYDIGHLCLTHFKTGKLSPQSLLPFVRQILGIYRKNRDKLIPSQQDKGVAWMWEEKYLDWRNDAALLLDLMGYLPDPQVERELNKALSFRDPRLKAFAVVSLLRLGKEVLPEDVADAAAGPELRNWLYDNLEELGKTNLYPKPLRTQEAFAESDMVNWLTFGTELGRAPDEIELMDVVSADVGQPYGVMDWYLFRFRTIPPHWVAEDGWMAGVSGPFTRNAAPTTRSLGDTFSTFTAWDSKTPDEHVRSIQELMTQWRDYHS